MTTIWSIFTFICSLINIYGVYEFFRDRKKRLTKYEKNLIKAALCNSHDCIVVLEKHYNPEVVVDALKDIDTIKQKLN